MSDIIDINVYQNIDDVTINVTDTVIEVNVNTVSSGSIGAWGSIIGDIADQTDLQNALNLKVDKVTGKGLSTNDFTNTLKTKLDGIQSGAEVNVNADWDSVSGDSEILNKPIIPSIDGLATVTYVDDQDDLKENDLGNPLVDGYVLSSTIAGVRSWVEQGGSSGGGTWGSITGNLADQIDLQSALDSKVDEVVGKGLSTNDFTDTLETKLNGIAEGAEVNVNADWNAISGDAQILNKPTIPAAVTNTSDLINDGEDGINPFITLNDIPEVTGFVPYTGATQDVNLGEFGVQLGNIEFDLTPTNAPTVIGSMYWNDTAGTLDLKLKGGNVTLQIGQETVARVVNKTATNITLLESNYQAVRVTGAQGQRPKVDLALANSDANSASTLGLVTETILNNQEGFITTSGQVQGINTTGSLQGETWADGDILYLSGTVAGRLTNIKPIAPIHTVIMGFVEYAHITQGKIFVKVDNGYELEELHNVSAISPNNNEVLAYDTATLLWKPKVVDKTYIGLGNVDNTSDLNKPISTATQTALNGKQDTLTNPITGTGTPNKLPKFTGTSALGNSLVTDDGTTVTVEGLLAATKSVSAGYVTTNFTNLASNGYVQHQFVVGANVANLQYAPTLFYKLVTNEANTPIILAPNSTTALTVLPSGASTFASTLQATRLGLGAAANLASYLNVIANTATVGQIYFPPSAVDYTGTLSGMLWNNTSEWKFYDGVLSSVNRLLKLNGNTALANANALNVVTSTGTGGNLGTLKAEVAFSRFATAVSYTILLTDVGFGWVIAVTSTAAARTITLPLANTVPSGWQITVKDESGGALTNNITIARSGSDTIDGATSNVIALNYGSRTLYSDGVSKWFII
jgi:hypothetical protein